MTDEPTPEQLPDNPTPEQQPVSPLAAVIPARPVAGAVIDTAWGTDVHDRVYTPQGCGVSGPALSVTAEVKLPLDTLSFGNSTYFDNPGDQLVIPAGGSGLYLITIAWGIANTVSWARMRPFRNGAPHIGGDTMRGVAGITVYSSHAYIAVLSDGDTLDVRGQADPADAADTSVTRFSVTRIGNAAPTSGP